MLLAWSILNPDTVLDIFVPLFEVTKDPRSHPELHVFLQRVIGIDSVDDESKTERRIYKKFPYPTLWTTHQNPPYTYWLVTSSFHYVSVVSVELIVPLLGFIICTRILLAWIIGGRCGDSVRLINAIPVSCLKVPFYKDTFAIRPHCGEAGDTDHLTSAFLTSHSISHGIMLRKVPALQYLFYLKQIGMAMSPLSNNALFLAYERNPFPDFFKIGLNISLSTDDPLQMHFTKVIFSVSNLCFARGAYFKLPTKQEPLLEEYSVAAHVRYFDSGTVSGLV